MTKNEAKPSPKNVVKEKQLDGKSRDVVRAIEICFEMLRYIIEKRGENNIPIKLKELRDEGVKILN